MGSSAYDEYPGIGLTTQLVRKEERGRHLRIPIWSERIYRAAAAGTDRTTAERITDRLTKRTALIVSGVALLGLLLSWLTMDRSLLQAALLLALLYPVLVLRRMDEGAKMRTRAIVIELPGYVNTVMLLVNAGETLPRAVVRACEQKLERQPEFRVHPLYRELQTAAFELANRTPFSEVLQAFGRRCAAKEVSMLVGALLLQYTRGGEDFLYAMRDLSRTLWDQRRAAARASGEEAAAKIVLPMIVIFAAVMAVIGAPVLFLVNS